MSSLCVASSCLMLTGGGGGSVGGVNIGTVPRGVGCGTQYDQQKTRAFQWQTCQYGCAPSARGNLHH
jgi:hypothetical protein